ncbi:MAG: type II toxin-antitoxin system VapC family toxin [Betaproteobacteria bacterium]
MILVDTSVWVAHLRREDVLLAELLEHSDVVMHPFIVGEIACGSLADRALVLELLQQLPVAMVAEPDEALDYIERHKLHGKGIGYVDVHLLASAAIGGTRLWTRDGRLRAAAQELDCDFPGASSR